MKAYLAVPLVINRDSNLAKNIVQILKDFEYEIISEWVTWNNPNPNMDPIQIVKRDLEAIANADLLISDVSSPSIGVGMEIMYAHTLRKKIICLHSTKKISNLIKGIPDIIVIKYSSINDLRSKLSSELTHS